QLPDDQVGFVVGQAVAVDAVGHDGSGAAGLGCGGSRLCPRGRAGGGLLPPWRGRRLPAPGAGVPPAPPGPPLPPHPSPLPDTASGNGAPGTGTATQRAQYSSSSSSTA